MAGTIEKAQQSLFLLAQQYTPEGTQVKSIIHQWIHAIAFGTPLYAGVSRDLVVDILIEAGVYEDQETFRQLVEDSIHLKYTNGHHFRFIDLFAGIGGMRIGFERVGGRCVFSSEFEKNAQQTYETNYGEYPFGDITKIPVQDIPDHDVLVGGFPCQPFSHAGLKLGIDDTRGTLFYNIARIIQEKRPLAVLLENVKGLISHDKGYTLKVVLTTLINEGYHCNIPDEIIRGDNIEMLKKEAKKMIMKSKEFGIPQNRQRIYIVLWRSDLPVEFIYPAPPRTETRVADILDPTVNGEFTISDKLWAGHLSRKAKNMQNGKGFGYGLVFPDSEYTNTISARYYKDGGEILVFQKNANPRKLSPREAANLQGFPRDFIINPSNTQAYKQFGNSVTVPVVEAVARHIYEQIIRPYAEQIVV